MIKKNRYSISLIIEIFAQLSKIKIIFKINKHSSDFSKIKNERNIRKFNHFYHEIRRLQITRFIVRFNRNFSIK